MNFLLPNLNAWMLGQFVGLAFAGATAWLLWLAAQRAFYALRNRTVRMAAVLGDMAAESIVLAASWACGRAIDRAEKWIAVAADARTQRKIWRKEFRSAMSWDEFQRQMKGAPQRDELLDAIGLLRLPASFTRAEFDTRFKQLMQRVHPDQGGSDELARLVNDARALILKRKGWKR
jgi:hypothetical protein